MKRRKRNSTSAPLRRPLRFERLEPRRLLYSTLANGMPILNSRLSAPAAIYLDFNYSLTRKRMPCRASMPQNNRANFPDSL